MSTYVYKIMSQSGNCYEVKEKEKGGVGRGLS